jgi:hypothetical protein
MNDFVISYLYVFFSPGAQDAYILETGAAVIYVWIGKGSSKDEKVHAMSLAAKYIDEKGYPKSTKVRRTRRPHI